MRTSLAEVVTVTDNKTKRPVGRPPKTDPTNVDSIKAKIVEQQNSFGAKCADKLDQLFNVMMDTALKDKKGVSITNRLSATRYCLEYAEKYLKDNPEEGEKAFNPEEEEKPKHQTPLISLVADKD
jgi:hypothetical protein